MSRSRRPSVTIHDYPEHLNPFNEEPPHSLSENHRDSQTKDSKHKFWTFGRSRKKRSNSFSIKSTWSGLFGKRKDAPDAREKRPATLITTVSSTYKSEPFVRPTAPLRISKDQQEFDEALGTLARRRKYTLDSSSRYSSSLTVNGDLARIYDGSPQDTTTSIMGDLTPKPPARRFGQISPKPTDKIPALDYEDREPKENGTVTLREKTEERTPVPPLRRFGNRSSQKLNASNFEPEDEANRSADAALRDENENVPEDYVFKRFTQDAVRKSNLSINSCASITSNVSSYGRKKRRAPQPPCRKDKLETPEENTAPKSEESLKIELQITEPIDIARVTEGIDKLTKGNNALTEEQNETVLSEQLPSGTDARAEDLVEPRCEQGTKISDGEGEARIDPTSRREASKEREESATVTSQPECEDGRDSREQSNEKQQVQVEYHRTSHDSLEIIKDVDVVNSASESDVSLRRQNSTNSLARSDSFSVKEEIEKIERQIKALEERDASRDSSQDETRDSNDKTNGRPSIHENRRHFFQDMVDVPGNDGVKIEFKELPREQKNIHFVRLTDPPVPAPSPSEPVKVIELHISEPIRQKPEILEDVNPIPKPRRHSALNLNEPQSDVNVADVYKNPEASDKRGKSF